MTELLHFATLSALCENNACRIDEELLTLIFTDWLGNILSTKGIHIVIDGMKQSCVH